MADIELVIKIPEKIYKYVQLMGSVSMLDTQQVANAIFDGVPFPKGHGRIMDVDKILKKMEEREEKLKDDRSMWETAGVKTALDIFGETIIEADKESKE